MSFQISPGVRVKERDLSLIIRGVPMNIGATVGDFEWGPVNEIRLVSDTGDLERTFGRPYDGNAKDWFCAYNFLQYSQDMRVVRVRPQITANSKIANATNIGNTALEYDWTRHPSFQGAYAENENYSAGDIVTWDDGSGEDIYQADVDVEGAPATLETGDWTELTITDNPYFESLTEDDTNGIYTKVVVDNISHFENFRGELARLMDDTPEELKFIARYPGDRGNDVAVSMSDVDNFDSWQYRNFFSESPDAENLEFAVAILQNGTPVETFVVSANPQAIDRNGQNMFVDKINDQSEFVYVIPENIYSLSQDLGSIEEFNENDPDGYDSGDIVSFQGSYYQAADDLTGQDWTGTIPTHDPDNWEAADLLTVSDINTTITLSEGENIQFSGSGNLAFSAAQIRGWDLIKGAKNLDVTYCIVGGTENTSVIRHVVFNVCEQRMDCVAFFSPPQSRVVNQENPAQEMADWYNNELNVNSSYAFADGNYKMQLDPYNRVYRWIPLCGDTAGLAARTSYTNDPWWSFAGLSRGQIRNVKRLGFIPSDAQEDELYKNNINIITSFPGEGFVLWGDKTMLKRTSAFDRINVRFLFIVLEKAIAKAARNYLFEFNDEFTRTRFVQAVEPFLRDVQSRRGIQRHEGRDGFYVLADERINTPQVIDSNEFRAEIFIKPNRSINFIELTFTATRTGVVFEELVSELYPEG